MAGFPLLKSGCVTQHPSSYEVGQAVQVIRFVDGSDQRFLNQGRQLRRWEIRLSLLSDTEILAIENFFSDRLGDYSTFSFPDPFTGAMVLNCRFASQELSVNNDDVNSSSTSLWIVETYG